MNQLFRRPSVTKASPARCFPLSDVYIALFSRNNAPADAVTLTLSGASGPPLLPFGLEVAALQLCLLILISFQAALRLRVRAFYRRYSTQLFTGSISALSRSLLANCQCGSLPHSLQSIHTGAPMLTLPAILSMVIYTPWPAFFAPYLVFSCPHSPKNISRFPLERKHNKASEL